MTQNQILDGTPLPTNTDRAATVRPRRWWRAVDQFTLETMNAPIPARVRAAMNSNGIYTAATETSTTETSTTDTATTETATTETATAGTAATETASTDFAGAIRDRAPGRRDRALPSDARVGSEFAAGIRADAPGRRS